MAKCKRYDCSQNVLIPVSLENQLMPGTLEFAIHTLIETRMNREVHVRFCGGLEVRFLRSTRLNLQVPQIIRQSFPFLNCHAPIPHRKTP
jgi:hypothetical protein